jgi:hypothetical protein
VPLHDLGKSQRDLGPVGQASRCGGKRGADERRRTGHRVQISETD